MTWADRAGTVFACEKTPVTASRGMAVTNHPLASAAAAEMMASGGNAIDATVAALFTLTVVEPMMVGIFGGGTALIGLADGRELVIDGLSTAPSSTKPDSFTPVSDSWPTYMETEGWANRVGPKAVAVPGNLKAWCEVAERFGRLPLSTLIEPAIRHASRGFAVTPYLATSIADTAFDLCKDEAIASVFLPGGKPLVAGDRLVQADYAETLRGIAQHGPGVPVWRRARTPGRRISREDRLVHPLPGSRAVRDGAARTGARHLSRGRDRRATAALLRRRPHHPDPQHAGSLRSPDAGFRHARDGSSRARVPQDRGGRPTRGDGGPCLRRRADGAPDLQGVCRRVPGSDQDGPCRHFRVARAVE